ncbi:MAG: hypothetical protein KatS3mg060_2857 [Dehalococcoidia bacterium]|nr:MAG: hypothetical protein KatS3mg060_2857 [Dehalococcoidia bacterium]
MVIAERVTFAVVGDYGVPTAGARAVAELVASWAPDFVVTVGDNNYPSGSSTTIDRAIGAHYWRFIAPYLGGYGPGADQPRFFPTLGNHDWDTQGARPYLDYFTLPGNERYYTVRWGPVQIFALDSDPREPDGVTASSRQATWFRDALAASPTCWKIVAFHHPPYSSGPHRGSDWMRWPFLTWGASIVLSGHDHTYERIERDGLPYIVNGLGGAPRYTFTTIEPGSVVRFNADFGALRVTATATETSYEFISVGGLLVDSFRLTGGCAAPLADDDFLPLVPAFSESGGGV